jgi:5-methylcytosine-specific restriction endonuclease McrA
VTWIGWLRLKPGWHLDPLDAALATIGDEDDLEEAIDRAWLGWSREHTETRRERIRFRPAALRHFPLTGPPDICQRCARWLPWPEELVTQPGWDLDHIVELQFGGLDHPSNLVRLCRPCHKAKPYPPDSMLDRGDDEEIRRFVLDWVRAGPPGGRRPQWNGSE